MMKTMLLNTHYTPEEAYSILMLLDELRDTLWQNYRDDIIEYCHQQQTDEVDACIEIGDDIIPF